MSVIAVLFSPCNSIPASLGNIYTYKTLSICALIANNQSIRTEPDCHAGRNAQREQEGEALPIVTTAVDNSLNNVGANHGRCTIRQAEKAEELEIQFVSKVCEGHHDGKYHVVVTRWGKLSHHRLRECIVWCLEQAKNYVIGPVVAVNTHTQTLST